MAETERIHGLHAVRTVLERAPERVRLLMLASSRKDAALAQLEQVARAAKIKIDLLAFPALEKLAGDVVHQGVLADVLPFAPWNEDQLLAALEHADKPLLVALDGVQDPHNLGACLRTADACGALAVIVPRDRAAPLNATARKVAAGAAETTPVVSVVNLARTLRLLKDAGLWIVGAAGDAPKRAHEVDLTGGVVIVMGAEGSGMRALTRQHCDHLVRLPQLGAVESLNVSVATGMMLYEAVRQRGAK